MFAQSNQLLRCALIKKVTVYIERDASNKLFRLFSPSSSLCPLALNVEINSYIETLFVKTLHRKPALKYRKGHLQFKPAPFRL